MTIQAKNVNQIVTSISVARELQQLANLSNESCVALFYILSSDTHKIDKLRSVIAKELYLAKLTDEFGNPRVHLRESAAKWQMALQIQAGFNLMPCAEPTRITQQNHKLVKGTSKAGNKLILEAEKTMFNTAFTINPLVRALMNKDIETANAKDLKDINMINSILNEFEKEHGDVPMYFPVSYDYRGRMYYRGGYLTPQGNDRMKGLLQFAEGAPIGEDGIWGIRYALIDAVGLKGCRQDQVNALDFKVLGDAVEGKYGYLAAALANELIEISQMEDYTKYVSHVVCHQDATCSGLQISAAITGDRATAEATNCTARGIELPKADVYGDVAQALVHLESDLGSACRTHGRSAVKKAVMTMGYGAGRLSLMRAVEEYMQGEGHTDWRMGAEDGDELMIALESVCGASNALKVVMQDLAGEAEELTWTVHDGFKVIQDKQSGDVLEYGDVSMEFDKKWDQDDNITAIAPNFVHSLDAAMMRESVRLLGNTPVACIHDSLGTRAADYSRAGWAVRQAFINIDAKRVTQEFLTAHNRQVPNMGDYDASEAMQSQWFFC